MLPGHHGAAALRVFAGVLREIVVVPDEFPVLLPVLVRRERHAVEFLAGRNVDQVHRAAVIRHGVLVLAALHVHRVGVARIGVRTDISLAERLVVKPEVRRAALVREAVAEVEQDAVGRHVGCVTQFGHVRTVLVERVGAECRGHLIADAVDHVLGARIGVGRRQRETEAPGFRHLRRDRGVVAVHVVGVVDQVGIDGLAVLIPDIAAFPIGARLGFARELEAAITPKTKALILCSPSNPTGSVYSAEELAGLAEVLKKHPDIIVIADEIYEHINYIGKHNSIASIEGMKDRTVIVNGVSKAYAMTGWRIGFIAGPEWIVKAVNKLQGQYTSGPCSVSQKAAEAAYTGSQEPVEEMRKAFERRRDLIVNLAKEVPGFEVNKPEGAFYLFPKCSYYYGKTDGTRVINNADDLAMYLLEVAHVACVGGTSFGAPECIRMSYATSDENIVEAIKRIKDALAALK